MTGIGGVEGHGIIISLDEQKAYQYIIVNFRNREHLIGVV